MSSSNHKMWISSTIFYSIFFLKSFLCCDCSVKNNDDNMKNRAENEIFLENNTITRINSDKNQQDFEEELVTEMVMEVSIEEATMADTTIIDTTITPTVETTTGYNIETTEINVDKHKLNECPHYKNGAKYDLNIMADVWENTYYQMKQKLICFRLHLKIVTVQEQKYYEKIYGNFNNVVQWDRCILEVKASMRKKSDTKKHFLQGTVSDRGVMDNIIIEAEYDDKTTTITLREEHPDQWLLVKDLLLMRDCDDGDIVVFSRVPFQPRKEDIMDALATFGEYNLNGTFGCVGNDDRNSVMVTDNYEVF